MSTDQQIPALGQMTPELLQLSRRLIGSYPSESLVTDFLGIIGPTTSPLATQDGLSRWCDCELHPAQQTFLSLTCREALFGGAAGGGKSQALLAAALQYAHIPGYAALILRRDYKRLALSSSSLLSRASDWLLPRGARYDATNYTFSLPCDGGGFSTITLGYFDKWADRMRYQSSEFQCIVWDELTEMPAEFYKFLFTRLRRTHDLDVPLRMRAATNPGGPGHIWVKKRFITDEAMEAIDSNEARGRVFWTPDGRAFVPSFIVDNPSLNQEEYEENLREVDPVTRARLMHGDWRVTEEGLIKPSWFRYFTMTGQIMNLYSDATLKGPPLFSIDERECQRVATCDTAGTAKDVADQQKQKRFSYSVIGVWDVVHLGDHTTLVLRHVWRDQVDFPGLCDAARLVLEEWGRPKLCIEDATNGRALASTLEREGYQTELAPTQGKDKVVRAAPLLNLWKDGYVYHDPFAAWREDFEDECLAWTGNPDETNDQIDMAAYAGQMADTGEIGGVSVVWMPSRDRRQRA